MSISEMASVSAGVVQHGSGHGSSMSKPSRVNLFLPAWVVYPSIVLEALNRDCADTIMLKVSISRPRPDFRYIQRLRLCKRLQENTILRDDGMQVGCEEDGVVEMWRRILGCDERGLTRDTSGSGGQRITLDGLKGAWHVHNHEI